MNELMLSGLIIYGWILVSIRFLNDKMLIITETFRETFQHAFNFLLLNHL